VGGVLGALIAPLIEESAGILAGSAIKSYTQIRLGRAIPWLTIGVWWVTFVEAHPATTTTASRQSAIRLLNLITNPP
jgi:hypothetical protein